MDNEKVDDVSRFMRSFMGLKFFEIKITLEIQCREFCFKSEKYYTRSKYDRDFWNVLFVKNCLAC